MDERGLDSVDLAWSHYLASSLPKPHIKRLLKRGDVSANALDYLAKHYEINEGAKINLNYGVLDHPGHVIIKKGHPFMITLDESYRGWHDAETAILAHELCHVVMNIAGIRGRNTYENELFTDSFCVFLGSGLVSRFSESVDFYKEGEYSKKLGYLNEYQRAYAMAIFMGQAGFALEDVRGMTWLRNQDLNGLNWAIETKKERDLTLYKGPLQVDKVRVQCPRCGSLLTKEKIVQCTECGGKWGKKLLGYRVF